MMYAMARLGIADIAHESVMDDQIGRRTTRTWQVVGVALEC
jgi:hypothetical protein